MALLSEAKRKEYFRALGLGDYNKANIKALQKKYFTRKGDPVRIAAIQSLMVCLVSAVLAFITEEPSWEKIVSAAVPILYCGVVSAGAGYTLQLVGQKYTDPTIASLLMSLESVFAVIAGSVILKERMTTREAVGCVIMFAAILLVQIPVKGKGKKAHG